MKSGGSGAEDREEAVLTDAGDNDWRARGLFVFKDCDGEGAPPSIEGDGELHHNGLM